MTAPTPTSTPDATLRGPHGPSGLHIVGGTYREFCPESVPAWDQLFGSGLRAAAAVQALAQADGRPATLVTCVGDDLAEDLAVYAGTFGVRVRVTRIADTVAFLYEHPLAPARMKPAAEALLPRVPLECAAPNVLRFGMPEADVWVRGERVVYDPQSPVPERFDTNGSSAQALAIVANLREAEALTGRSAEAEGVGAIGRALCREHGAAVGVIKRGARGLSVFAASDGDVTEATLPGYETQRVWPIGSGDTFSAVFAYHWAERRSDPLAAADAASRATAYYCETRQPVSPVDVEAALGRRLRRLRPAPEGERRQVYLAGPFFTMAQRWLIRHVRRSLRDQGVEVFSPLNDVGFGPAAQVAGADMEGLRASDAVLAIVDGADAGTLFEVGAATERGIPVVALAEVEPDANLTMVIGTGNVVARDIATAVYRAVWAALEAPPRAARSGLTAGPPASAGPGGPSAPG